MTNRGEKDRVEEVLKLSKEPSAQTCHLAEALALGLSVVVKWDKATAEVEPGSIPDHQALAKFASFTESEIEIQRDWATRAQEQHVARVSVEKLVAAASRQIADNAAKDAASRRRWWGGVWQNVFASFVWAFMLLGIGAIAVQANGGDLATVWTSLRSQKAEGQPPPPR